MKKGIKPSHQWIILLAALLALFTLLAGQERVHERVEVIYQEILVRVFDGSRPVPGLRAGDFTLYEDSKPVKVAYCRELRRSLARPEVDAGITAAKPKPRLFLFMFWLNEESREWPKAWDYFVREIYRPGDRVVLSDASRAVEVRSLEGEKEKVDAFFADLAEDLKRKQLSKNKLVSDLQWSAGEFYNDLVAYSNMKTKTPPPEGPLLERFKTSYLGALNEYRLERLKGDPAWLERLATALKAVEAEKWALLFLQNERLPLLHRDSRLLRDAPMSQDTITKLKGFMDETERQVKLGSDVTSYLRDLRPLFVGANTTYHVFLSDAAGEMRSNEHLQWQPVFSSWEGAFRQISADTGGRVSNTTRLGEALRQAAEKEDIYYVLTFKPGPGEDRRRRLQVEVKRPGLKVVFSRKLELGEVFPLKIQALEWRDGKLVISLSDYQRAYGDAGLKGRLRVGVRAHVRGGDPLAVEKEILAGEPTVDVEMALHFPAPGSYQVHVEVQDLLTGNRATAEKEIAVLPPPAPVPEPEVDAPPLPEELEPVMARAADYCRRLKEAAFRFYCLEVVEERVLERNPLTKRTEPVERRWEYDYQITGSGGGISEQRRLVREGTRKMDKENAALETRFSSHYSVFMPVTLLALENRAAYAYRLAGRDRIGRSRCVVVEATPLRAEGVGIAQGRAWIDEKDGSVLKIEMNPRGVAGAEELEKAARASQARLLLEVSHQYFVSHGGLRFPSMTMFREAYVLEKVVTEKSREMAGGDLTRSGMIITLPQLEGRRREIEFYRLRQDYGKYRFFEVDSQVEIREP